MTEKANFCWDSVPTLTGTVARPAAGADFESTTVPAGYKYLFLRAAFAETTDATGANRYPSMWIASNGSAVDSWIISATAIVASQSAVSVAFVLGSGTAGVATTNLGISIGIGASGIEMPAGTVFNFPMINKQAGDRPDGALTYVYKKAPA